MKIICKEVGTIEEFIHYMRLRTQVFIIEQGFKPGWEPDEDDIKARHFIALNGNEVIATGRFREISKDEIKIERMTTKKEFRSQGVGRALLDFMISEIKKLNPKKIWLRSQLQAKEFYEKGGFETNSKPFEIYGVMHIDLQYRELQK